MRRMSPQDRVLFTATEWALLQASWPPKLEALNPARVKTQTARARAYADKYRNLARRHRRTEKVTLGRGVPPGAANRRTERKAKLLVDALHRFERRLTALEQETRRKSSCRAEPSTGLARGAVTQRETLRRKRQRRQTVSKSTKSARVTRQFKKSRMRAIQGHIRASGKRRQGRRDARR